MRDNDYADYMIFIKAAAKLGAFSTSEAAKATGLKPRRLKTIMIKLSSWGVLFKVGGRPLKYNLSSVAEDVLNKHRQQKAVDEQEARKRSQERLEAARRAKEKKEADMFLRGMMFVEKANVAGMGSKLFKRLDSLLNGARA